MLHAPLAKVPVAFFFLRNTMSALPPLELKNAHACFGGAQRFYEHFSAEIGLNMKFSVFLDRKSTRLNSSHSQISYAVFCLKKKKNKHKKIKGPHRTSQPREATYP